MPVIKVDGEQYEVEDGQNVLEAVLSIGLNLPYFCWHPEMGSVGSCRQCAIKVYADKDDKRGRLVMSCLTPVKEDMQLSIKDDQAVDFRAGVIEVLMTNHPHDCPVCEEGGDCHLQDMTEMSGHTSRRYADTKRTHENQYLGPFIKHDMNRCIACYRCVRYYNDYAGANDLGVFGAHNDVFFGRAESGCLENEFSGNLVEVCPTGVFTDKTFSQHFTRKWDLQTAPSVCSHCSVGCNTIPGSRYEKIKRVSNRFHEQVNRYFLCDRGRFGYGYNHSEQRLKAPLLLNKNKPEDVSEKQTAIVEDKAVRILASLLLQSSEESLLLGVGSPRASLETNFGLQSLVGEENFYSGISDREQEITHLLTSFVSSGCVNIPSLKQIEQCDAVIVIGEDATQHSPRVALALRQAVRNAGVEHALSQGIEKWADAAVRNSAQNIRSPLYSLTSYVTALDDVATKVYYLGPDDIANKICLMAKCLDRTVPADASREALIDQVEIVEALTRAKRPLIVCGTSQKHMGLVQSAINLAVALNHKKQEKIDFYCCIDECNTMGSAILSREHPDNNFDQLQERIEEASRKKQKTTLIICENDLSRRMSFGQYAAIMEGADTVVVMDYITHKTAKNADLVLPVPSHFESSGSLVSAEGRLQPFYSVMDQKFGTNYNWQWFNKVCDYEQQSSHAESSHKPIIKWNTLGALAEEMGNRFAYFMIAREHYKNISGVDGQEVARQTHRNSGRTAIHAKEQVSEEKPPVDTNAPLTYSMEGQQSNVEKSLFNHVWTPGWNSNQAMTKFVEGASERNKQWATGTHIFTGQKGKQEKFKYLQVASGAGIEKSEFLAVPRVDLAGTEELSSLAEAMAERSLEPMIFINKKDAKENGLVESDAAKVSCNNRDYCCYVTIDNSLAEGVVAISTGVREQPEWVGILPASVRIEKDTEREKKLSNWVAIKGGSLRIESDEYST